MSTLYLDHPDLRMSLEHGALVLHRAGVRVRSVPLGLLDRIIVQGDVALSAGVLGRLAEAGVALAVCSRRHSRQQARLVGAGHNDARIRLAQYHAADRAELKLRLARHAVALRLRGQSLLLAELLAARPDTRKPLFDAHQQILALRATLTEAAGLPALRGKEGAATRSFFAAYAAVLPPALGFTGRNRRPPRDPANAALSLAYAILHREACACAFGVGLDPWIGFLHEPAFGRESLACDLVELARYHAEHAVWRAFRDRRLTVEHFSHDGGACLLGKSGRAAFYTDLEAWLAPARRRLRAHARLLVRFLRERCPERFTAGDEEEF